MEYQAALKRRADIPNLRISQYLFCGYAESMKSSLVCGICSRYKRCDFIREYEEVAQILRVMMFCEKYGKQKTMYTAKAMRGNVDD